MMALYCGPFPLPLNNNKTDNILQLFIVCTLADSFCVAFSFHICRVSVSYSLILMLTPTTSSPVKMGRRGSQTTIIIHINIILWMLINANEYEKPTQLDNYFVNLLLLAQQL